MKLFTQLLHPRLESRVGCGQAISLLHQNLQNQQCRQRDTDQAKRNTHTWLAPKCPPSCITDKRDVLRIITCVERELAENVAIVSMFAA